MWKFSWYLRTSYRPCIRPETFMRRAQTWLMAVSGSTTLNGPRQAFILYQHLSSYRIKLFAIRCNVPTSPHFFVLAKIVSPQLHAQTTEISPFPHRDLPQLFESMMTIPDFQRGPHHYLWNDVELHQPPAIKAYLARR
jgi:hypothetical protein